MHVPVYCIFVFCLLCYRDGLHESNVVTKTFQVEDVGPPDEDSSLLDVDIDPWADNVPKTSKSYLRSGLNKKKVRRPSDLFQKQTCTNSQTVTCVQNQIVANL